MGHQPCWTPQDMDKIKRMEKEARDKEKE